MLEAAFSALSSYDYDHDTIMRGKFCSWKEQSI